MFLSGHDPQPSRPSDPKGEEPGSITSGSGAPSLTSLPSELSAESAGMEKILLEDGLLTADQIARARRIQSRLEQHKPLATVLVELGLISRARLEQSLRQHQKRLTVEEILVERGLLAPERLHEGEQALAASGNGSLGRLLIDMGAVSERDYIETYCNRHDLPFVLSDVALVDPMLLKRINLKYLIKQRVLPLSIEDGRLSVLTDELETPAVLAELERLYGATIELALTTRAQLDTTFAALEKGEGTVEHGESEGSIQYHQIEDNIDSGRVTDIVDHIFLRAIRQGASDIHIEPMQSKLRVRFRIDGSLVHITDYPFSYAARIISRIKVLAKADLAEHRAHQDGKIYVRLGDEGIDLRASIYVTVFGENAVLRVLRKERGLLSVEEMGMSQSMAQTFVEDVLLPSTGIVLATGPTGSGKTTTLYAAVDRLNDDTKKIITCEDPVEYVIEGITQCSILNRPGMNFVDSLKSIVRQDPDVILIGEIRDRESAEMAIQSALTGHKVLSTFHTEDSVGALVRLMDMNIETFMIASTVTAVLAQRLVRRLCPHCQVEYTPSPQETRALSIQRDELSSYHLTRGRGCPECYHTGFRGRLGIYELLVMTDSMRDAILQKKPAHELRRLAAEDPGFVFLQEDGVAKALRGQTTLFEVLENTPRCHSMRPVGRLLEMYG